MYKDRAVSRIIMNKWVTTVLAGAVFGLLPNTTAMAQVPGDELSPIPQNRRSVDS